MRRPHRFLLLALLAGCSGTAPAALVGPAPATAATPPACDVTIYPVAPPYEVDDLGPIQASCFSSMKSWLTCGIDQPNLLQVACAAGADTVFGLYETVGGAAPPQEGDGRLMHARLGKRRHAAPAPPAGHSADRG